MRIHELPSICREDCPLRLKLSAIEIEQVLGSSIVEMCDDAAAQLVLGGMALGACPNWQRFLYTETHSPG